jgi:hypothetical protein
MFAELALRFLVGGLVVSIFAVIGDLLWPKSFAGLLGAAPSVALATLGLTYSMKPAAYVAAEGRSMMAGAVAFAGYGLTTRLIMRYQWPALLSATVAWAAWLAIALALWAALLR